MNVFVHLILMSMRKRVPLEINQINLIIKQTNNNKTTQHNNKKTTKGILLNLANTLSPSSLFHLQEERKIHHPSPITHDFPPTTSTPSTPHSAHRYAPSSPTLHPFWSTNLLLILQQKHSRPQYVT